MKSKKKIGNERYREARERLRVQELRRDWDEGGELKRVSERGGVRVEVKKSWGKVRSKEELRMRSCSGTRDEKDLRRCEEQGRNSSYWRSWV